MCAQGLPPGGLRRIILTASGGAFREWPVDKLKTVTVADAIKHPNWSMGKKITVDSASLMNKVGRRLNTDTVSLLGGSGIMHSHNAWSNCSRLPKEYPQFQAWSHFSRLLRSLSGRSWSLTTDWLLKSGVL